MNVGANKMIQESVIEESTKMMQAVNLLIVKHGKNWNLIYRQVILSYLRMYAVLPENVTMDIKGIWNCLIRV